MLFKKYLNRHIIKRIISQEFLQENVSKEILLCLFVSYRSPTTLTFCGNRGRRKNPLKSGENNDELF